MNLLTLPKAAAMVPTKPHPVTIYRWASQGIRGVKLDTRIIGGRRYTTAQAVERFLAEVEAATMAGQGLTHDERNTRHD